MVIARGLLYMDVILGAQNNTPVFPSMELYEWDV